MGGKKRKRSSGVRPLLGFKPLTSQRAARTITSKFHKLSHALERTRNQDDKAENKRLKKELEELGGREMYQNASILLTDLNKSSSKWVFQNLTRMQRRPGKNMPKLRTLEVGAINTQILRCPWLSVRAIDIKSRHPDIEEIDFFDVNASGEFDVVVNAMVINCVETPEKRGKMLLLLHRHLKTNGTLMLSLPRRCIEQTSKSKPNVGAGKKKKSAHHSMSKDLLFRILNFIGFEIENYNTSPKISFVCAVKTNANPNKSALCSLFGNSDIDRPAAPAISQQKHKHQLEQHRIGSSDSFAISFRADCFQ